MNDGNLSFRKTANLYVKVEERRKPWKSTYIGAAVCVTTIYVICVERKNESGSNVYRRQVLESSNWRAEVTQ